MSFLAIRIIHFERLITQRGDIVSAKRILEVNGLRKKFFTDDGEIPSVDSVWFKIHVKI
jgi:hypothetical protein